MPTATTPPAPRPTGVQFATAFDGQLARRTVSPFYSVGIVFVGVMLVLLPVVYCAMIGGVGYLVYLHATHDTAMITAVGNVRVMIFLFLAYAAPIVAGAILILFMVLPLFSRRRTRERPVTLTRREEPLLYAYVDKLCDTMRAPRPARIDVTPAANASAHIDNGLLGLVRRRLVLTIGLPLVQELDLRCFTAVLAHEMGHFAQGGSMRLSYVVRHINNWFGRLAWGQSNIDAMLDNLAASEHWAIGLIALLARLGVGIARLVLKGLAMTSHFFSMGLSRQAEYDADRQAARIVGSAAMITALERLPALSAANERATIDALGGWTHRNLPDDLVTLTDRTLRRHEAGLRVALASAIKSEKGSFFDTHPPMGKRIRTLRAAALAGVLKLDAPAATLFEDFEERSKLATVDLYLAVFGKSLRPEHIVPVV